MPSYDYTFRILLIGDVSAGKVAFIKRYCYDTFNPDERLTIGVDFHVKTIDLNNKRIKLQLSDVGGEERFRFLLPTYSKGTNGAFLLYNIANQASLNHLSEWIEIFRENAGDVPIVLIGSKLDLDVYREVSRDDGLLFAKKYNLASFLEVYSKTGENVDKAFEILINELIERHSQDL